MSDQDAKDTSGDFVLTGPWARWFHLTGSFETLLKGESSRGAAVLARGYVESLLEEVLLRHAIANVGDRRAVGRAMAGGFERKIEVAKTILHLDPGIVSRLGAIKGVGDTFAHSPYVRSFLEPALAQYFNKMDWGLRVRDPATVGGTNTPVKNENQGNRMLAMTVNHVLAALAEELEKYAEPSEEEVPLVRPSNADGSF